MYKLCVDGEERSILSGMSLQDALSSFVNQHSKHCQHNMLVKVGSPTTIVCYEWRRDSGKNQKRWSLLYSYDPITDDYVDKNGQPYLN